MWTAQERQLLVQAGDRRGGQVWQGALRGQACHGRGHLCHSRDLRAVLEAGGTRVAERGTLGGDGGSQFYNRGWKL